MATRHGAKTYIQLLLDPHRAELLQNLAAEEKLRPTAYMRDALYTHLKRVLPASVYDDALAKDQAVWQSSVKNRVDGRASKAVKQLPNKGQKVSEIVLAEKAQQIIDILAAEKEVES